MRWVESARSAKISVSTSVMSLSIPSTTGCVVVDDLVDDRPDRGRGPGLEQLGMGLEVLADPRELARGAVAHRDHVGARDEEHDLAELDLLLGVVVAGGAQDDEVGVVVVLELRPLVGAVGVLERELVQVEALADVAQLLHRRLEQAEPDEVAVADDARSRRRRAAAVPSCWRTPSR